MSAIFRCDEVEQRAGALIDGELPLVEALRMRAHLAICRACRARVGQLRHTIGVLRAVAREEPAPAAQAMVAAAVVGRGREEESR